MMRARDAGALVVVLLGCAQPANLGTDADAGGRIDERTSDAGTDSDAGTEAGAVESPRDVPVAPDLAPEVGDLTVDSDAGTEAYAVESPLDVPVTPDSAPEVGDLAADNGDAAAPDSADTAPDCEDLEAEAAPECLVDQDCDDGDPDTLDSCDPALGCQHVLNLPDPVSTVVGEEVEELELEWPSGSAVSVEIFPAAFDPGTKVDVQPLGLNDIKKPLPGILIDAIAFKFLPGAPLKHPVPATISYDYQINEDERYSLLHWDEALKRFEPVPILDKDLEGNKIAFSLREAGEYYLLYVYVEALWLKRLSQDTWQSKVVVEQWPGLVLGSVTATYASSPCQIGPGPQAGVFVGVLGGAATVEIGAPPADAPGVRLLELSFTVLVTNEDGNPMTQVGYDVVLWRQDVVREHADSGQELLSKFAPLFQFAPGEKSFPASLSPFLQATTAITTPSGRLHSVSGADATGTAMAMYGDRGAIMLFDGEALPQPANAAEGTVYGRAFDLGGDKIALVYALHFPYSRLLGPAADASGTHRGDVRYVVVVLSAGAPESITLSQHLPGSAIDYLGDEDMPIWKLSGFGGGHLTLSWQEALRCKRSTAQESNEEHPWVFVGADSHALYPRKGKYLVTLPGGSSQFEETAGGDDLGVWQPPDFKWACDILPQYALVSPPALQDLASEGANGHLLFSGRFGTSRYADNGLAPYGQAWFDPSAFSAEASSGSFDPGTNCYKCLSTSQVMSVDGLAGGFCFQNPFPYYCQCSACGAVIGKSFLIFPKDFECKDVDFCKQFELDALCKTGLTVEWWADVPYNGVVIPNKESPWQADVMVSIPYPPTCFTSAENTAGVTANLCAADACCWDTYGAVKGVCYPQL